MTIEGSLPPYDAVSLVDPSNDATSSLSPDSVVVEVCEVVEAETALTAKLAKAPAARISLDLLDAGTSSSLHSDFWVSRLAAGLLSVSAGAAI